MQEARVLHTFNTTSDVTCDKLVYYTHLIQRQTRHARSSWKACLVLATWTLMGHVTYS